LAAQQMAIYFKRCFVSHPYNNARLVTEMDNELTRYHKITFNSDGFIIDSHETTIYIANSKLLLLHVFSMGQRSSTAACLTLCMSTFIGSCSGASYI